MTDLIDKEHAHHSIERISE